MSLMLPEEQNRDIPVPIQIIACQDLLDRLHDYSKEGWLRKSSKLVETYQKTTEFWFRLKPLENLLNKFSWDHRFIVLRKGCIYCFANEFSEKPSSCYSLYGYNKISRVVDTDMTSGGKVWMFKIEPAFTDMMKTLYFYASSEPYMKEWMQAIHSEMLLIKKLLSGNTLDRFGKTQLESEREYNEIEEPMYDAAQKPAKLDRKKITKMFSRDEDASDKGDKRKELSRKSRRPLPVPDEETAKRQDPIMPVYTDDEDDSDEMDKKPAPPSRRSRRHLQQREPSGTVGDQTLSQHSNEMPPDDLVKKIEKSKESHKREKSLKGDLGAKPKVPTPDAIRSKPQVSSKPYYNKEPMPPPAPPKDVSDVDTEEDDEQIVEDDVVWKRERALYKTGVMEHALWDDTKEKGIARLHRIGQVGVYFIRDGKAASAHKIDKTLCVFGQGKKVLNYKIRLKHDGQGNVFYSLMDDTPIKGVEEFLKYYQQNELPSARQFKLTVPHSYYRE